MLNTKEGSLDVNHPGIDNLEKDMPALSNPLSPLSVFVNKSLQEGVCFIFPIFWDVLIAVSFPVKVPTGLTFALFFTYVFLVVQLVFEDILLLNPRIFFDFF